MGDLQVGCDLLRPAERFDELFGHARIVTDCGCKCKPNL